MGEETNKPAAPVAVATVSRAEGAARVSSMLVELAQKAANEGEHDVVIDTLRALQQKPGVQTTEFYVALLLNAVGFGMQFWPGHEAVGGALMTVGGAAYMLSRGIVKAAAVKAAS